MTTGMRISRRIIRLVVNQLTFPVMTAMRVLLFFYYSTVMYKTKFYYNSDVWDTVMILYVICQLVCAIDSWAHTSYVNSILSLKLGVTVFFILLFFMWCLICITYLLLIIVYFNISFFLSYFHFILFLLLLEFFLCPLFSDLFSLLLIVFFHVSWNVLWYF